jgi:Tol biopolymer transport system component
MPMTSGTRLGEYEIVAPIGGGDGGEVYLARDLRLDQLIALRVLSAEIADDSGRMARIQRETSILAAVDHPNLTKVYKLSTTFGMSRHDSVQALAMELVSGPTLDERLAKGPIPMGEALGLARQIADGLGALHEKRILHRNLTPGNVKITANGRVKLLDCGLASLDLMNPYRAAYTAPEQSARREADRRADIWSFGTILYEMLSGRRAFAGDAAADVRVAMLIFEPDWKALPAETPPEVVNLLQRCLTRALEHRPQSIYDAQRVLSEYGPAEAEAEPVEAEAAPGVSAIPAEGPLVTAEPAAAAVAGVAEAALAASARVAETKPVAANLVAGGGAGVVRPAPEESAAPAETPPLFKDFVGGGGGRGFRREPEARSAPPARRTPPFGGMLGLNLTNDEEQPEEEAGELPIEETDVVEDTDVLLEDTWTARIQRAGRRVDWRRALSWSIPGILAGAFIAWGMLRLVEARVGPHVRRLSIAMPAGEYDPDHAPELALSPDGSQVVYSAMDGDKSRLYLRPLDGIEAEPIRGTEGAMAPFFSPDGEWLGYFTQGSLKKVRLAGGMAETLCSGPFSERGVGASWSKDGTIFFQEKGGLYRVPSEGGNCASVAGPDASGRAPGWPSVLPGGGLLFSLYGGYDFNLATIAALAAKSGSWEALGQEGTNPHYVGGGYLVAARGGSLVAEPFDLESLKFSGPAVTVVDGVLTDMWEGKARFALSGDGTLAYIPGGGGGNGRKVVLVDDYGRARDLTSSHGPFEDPALSPDGRQIAMRVEGEQPGIWIYDIGPETRTRLTAGNELDPCWTPDGRRVIYSAYRDGEYGLYSRRADGSGPEEELARGPDMVLATSVSPSGRELAFFERSGEIGGGSRIVIMPLEGGGGPRIIVSGKHHVAIPKFSPDGRALAYESDDSGQMEVYVQPYPGGGERRQVSNGGGVMPVWSRNGREIFYTNGGKLMAVPVDTVRAGVVGPARLVSEGGYGMAFHDYDVMGNGKRFLAIQDAVQARGVHEIKVVFNWVEEMKWEVARGKR